jgi:hypothetical protein
MKSKYKDDFYVTFNGQRINLENIKILEKILKQQEVYGLCDNELLGLMIIYREKGYRPYLKLFVSDKKYYYNFMIFLRWNIFGELYLKIKKTSPLVKVANYYKWQFKGLKDNDEIMFYNKNIKGSNHDDNYYKD